MGGGLGRVAHHPDYYLSDGSVSFLCKTVLFRVHRSFFERESEVFRDWFTSATADDPHSGTDAKPFTLDVPPDDFAQFLWVWYDREYAYRQQTKANWLVILRLATRWRFDKIRELAVRELDFLSLPPAERISIYNEHGIDGERLVSSYVELCKSPTVPSEADARLLQMESLINVLQARENAQRKAVELGHESPTSACLEDEVLREIVSKFFKKGLNPRSSGTPTGSGDQASDLNGERTHKTQAGTSTIKVGEPQVPDRKAQTTGRPPNDTPQASSHGRGRQEREQVETNDKREGKKGEGEDESKLEERQKQEKAKQEKEKEAREKEQRTEQKPPRNPRNRT